MAKIAKHAVHKVHRAIAHRAIMADPRENRVPFGIKELDSMIQGGLERNSINVVRGATGVGKTILCLQFLHAGCVKYDEPGVFISFSESKHSIFNTARRMGCDIEKFEGKHFEFIKHSPHEVERILKEGGGTIKDTLESIGAKRIVIDSLTAYSLLFEKQYQSNEGVLELFEILKGWGVTTLVTDEEETSIKGFESGRLGFLSDSIINMYYVRMRGEKSRAIEILKMRRTAHSEKVVPFEIGNNGIVVYPEMKVL